jgi:hypothetical protein
MLRFLASIAILISIPALGGVAGSPPAPSSNPQSGLTPAFAAIRSAWFVPRKEAVSAANRPGMTLEEFAILGMVRHYSGEPLEEILASKKGPRTWAAVIRDMGGELSELVFRGNARYPMTMTLAKPGDAEPASVERRISLLAQVLTLERLKGDGPEAILQSLRSGQSFESMLVPPKPAPRRQPRERPRHLRGRGQGGPGGLGRAGNTGNHGEIGS